MSRKLVGRWNPLNLKMPTGQYSRCSHENKLVAGFAKIAYNCRDAEGMRKIRLLQS